MDNYDRIEQDVHEFKKYIKMVMDLLADSYKWLKLSEYAEMEEDKNKYKQVSDTLFNMFMVEHGNIGAKFKKD